MKHIGPLIVALALASIACSGGSKSSPDPVVARTDDGADSGGASSAEPDTVAICEAAMDAAMSSHEASWEIIAAKGAPSNLEEMAAAACQLFCGRSTECAIEDACASLSASKLADLQLDRTAPENTRQCVDKCNQSRLTKKQIQTLGTCAQDDEASCATFRECTDAAHGTAGN